MDEWYLLKTRPRQELRAVENLERQGFEPFCPLMKKKSRDTFEALFPGYIFLLNEKKYAEVLPWEKVRSTRGVYDFVKFGGKPATVPNELIDGLLEREDHLRSVPVFKTGQKVVFKDGPFADLEGIYLCDKGEQRCMVLLNIISREQPILADQANLRS
ncbi:transcription termination/antitermination NusG family protein [Parendozoicomonas haliclonae]|uniref:Transcription antitermination protein RfaH n=1 Tax=Parendozoicomonas haliclonae TaxID=1960125 RepID=A0A1X7AGV8_9GAMM|nr:transcription termination/antitermination NusG family protein [Parendozoicomonas haliclonae]SMA41469.1 Transcription antitermination protein RfaH [Parendozoicomonas haliclonae]